MSKKVKIAHNYDELEDQIILTLQDRQLLGTNGLQDDGDVLQNDEMLYASQAKHNSELRGRLQTISNAASSHLQAKNQGQTEILPHYNDYSFKPQTIEVEEGAVIKPRKAKKSKALGQDYLQEATTSRLNSDYSNKDKKFIPKANNSRDLLNFLQETAEDNGPGLKRELEIDHIIEGSINQIRKKRILEGQIKNIVQRAEKGENEEESMLMKSIEMSRKRAEKDKQAKFNLLEAIKEQDEGENIDQSKQVQIQLNPIAYKSSENARRDHKIDIKQAVSGTTSAVYINLPSERLVRKTEPKAQLPESFKELTAQQLEKMREEVSFLQDRELGIGLSATLAYLRQNALLGQQEQVGRYNDKSVNYNDPNDRIKLEYRNASGKLMKPKQAYRYICAKFHGEGAKKNKVETRKKRELEELRVKQRQNSGGQLQGLLEKHQAQTGEAHMVLNFGGKAAK